MSIDNAECEDQIYDAIFNATLSKELIVDKGVGPEHFASLNDLPEGFHVSGKELSYMLAHPHIVMHGGAFAGVKATASENWFTKKFLKTTDRTVSDDDIVYTPEADMNIRALAALYRINGHSVTVMLPKPGNIDGIYATDSDKTFQVVKAKMIDGERRWEFEKPVSILPNFTHESRHVEVPWKKRFMETSYRNPNHRARRLILQMQYMMEFGDTRIVFHRTAGAKTGFVLAGIALSDDMAIGRSTQEGHEEFQGYLRGFVSPDINLETIYLKQPFYHMDTTGPNTSGRHMFTHPNAYEEESYELLKHLFGDGLVEIPFDDIGMAFGGNATSFGDKVYISDIISERTAKMIAEHGYDVYLTPIPFTMASGGGHRCMTSVNPHIYVPGGYELDLHGEGKNTTQGQIFKQEINYEKATIVLREQNSNGKWVNERELTNVVKEHRELYWQEMRRHHLI